MQDYRVDPLPKSKCEEDLNQDTSNLIEDIERFGDSHFCIECDETVWIPDLAADGDLVPCECCGALHQVVVSEDGEDKYLALCDE